MPIITQLFLLVGLCAGFILNSDPGKNVSLAASPGNLPAKGTIVYSSPNNAGPLNPHLYSPNQMYAQEMLYEPLVQLAPDGRLAPGLAESWEVSPNGLIYTFHLRPGVFFSDGQPFNAQAAVKNFQAIMRNAKRHEWLPITEKIQSFEARGELTFELRLNAPYYPALDDLSLPRPFRFISPAAMPDDGRTHQGIKAPVGTGPWKLIKSSLGEFDLFERNDNYWGEKPKVKNILVKVIPDPLSRAVALETGEIDLIYGSGQISYDTFSALRRNPAYATAISRPVGGLGLAVNSAQPPTDELAVRLALQYAADKPGLIHGVFLDTQIQADSLFAPDVPYCDIGLTPFEFNLPKAVALLEEAGWRLPPGSKVREKNGRKLEIPLCYVGSDAAQRAIAEVLQAQYAKAGILLNLLGEEEDSFYKRQRDGSFGLIVNSTWGPPFEPHAIVGSMRQPSHADYQAQLGLPMKAELDRSITEVLAAQDPARRQELYRHILDTLHTQAVYLPIFRYSLLEAHKKDRLGNVRFAPGRSKIDFEVFEKK